MNHTPPEYQVVSDDSVAFAAALAGELGQKLQGARLEQVRQPTAAEMALQFWGRHGRQTLRLVMEAPRPRLLLQAGRSASASTPPRFCQLLRARLKGVRGFSAVAGAERLVLAGTGSAREPVHLMIDLAPPRGNLLLVDGEGRVVDLLHRMPAGEGPQPGDLLAWTSSEQTSGPSNLFRVARGRVGLEVLPAEPHGLPGSAGSALEAMAELDRQFRADALEARRSLIGRELRKICKRLKRRASQIEADLDRHVRACGSRHWADLLMIERHRLRRGLDEIEVTDLFADPPVTLTIPLDPALTPEGNIDRLFRLARKGERALGVARERLDLTREELVKLAALERAIPEAETEEEIASLQQRLHRVGMRKRRTGATGRSHEVESPWRSTRSPRGFTIYIGRNNRANDRMLRELARPDDLWFHARDIPGAHVLLKRQRQQVVPDTDQAFAASLAAGYSRAGDEGKVAVIVALCKDLRKPPGARPGEVRVLASKTLIVKPQRLSEES